MVLASGILLVGILSVLQLVPAALKSNLYNRMDTMTTTVAQHELDQMLNQPLSSTSFTDKDGNVISLGGAGSTGSPVIMQTNPNFGSTAVIDFSAAPVPGFNVQGYQDQHDPNWPNGPQFELRWAVIPLTSNGLTIGKRIIIGCRQTNAAQLMLPVNLDTMVQR